MAVSAVPEMMQVPLFAGEGKVGTTEKPVPQPGDGQLLLQVKANALCGSEQGQFYRGSDVTPGHEAAGIVVAAGANTHTAVGTHGVVFLMDYCGACRNCKLGYTNQCLNKRADMGFNRDGGYGVYELVNENIFFPVDENISLTDATLLLDIMGTNGHGLMRAHLVRPDIETVLVTGAGPIGLGMLAMAKITLGRDVPVLISDMIPWRLQLAERLGGLPVNLREMTLEAGARRHGIETFDAAFDTSGKGSARQSSLQLLGKRGVQVCIGHGEGLSLTVSPDLIATERAVLGSEYFRFNELQANLELLREHGDYLRQIITHRFGVDEIQHAFELFFGGETGKVVIEQ